MLLHLLHLLSRALVDFPTVLSGNWLSIILPFAIFVAAEGYNFHKGSWSAVRPTLKRDVLIMTTAYGLLFLWSVVRTVYSDHKDMVAAAGKFKSQWHQTQQGDAQILQSVRSDLDRQISDLKVTCARNEGVADTLGKQNRDQQNTINNCQTQALKLLAPEPFKIVPLILEPAAAGVGQHHTKWLLLTNKTITPINLQVVCNRRFVSANASIVGSGFTAGGASKVADTQYQVNISSPAWSPEAPLLFNMDFTGTSDNACSFREY